MRWKRGSTSSRTRNAELEQQAELNEGRLETVETRAAKAAQFGWGPTIADPNGNFTFKPRGVVEADAAAFVERKGGYDYNNGTGFRRARIGFEGTALKWWNYRIEVDFAGNVVNLTDAYLQYTKIPKTVITAGQFKAPFGLESNNSDNYNIFLERGMFTNAFGNVGAERRIGASIAYAPKETLNLAVGVFGDNESIGRSSVAPITNTPDESWGVNGRADLGADIRYRQDRSPRRVRLLSHGAQVRRRGRRGPPLRASKHPNRQWQHLDSGVITGVQSLRYLGGEAAGVFGPLTVAGEVGKLWLDRPNLVNKSFTGFYGYAAYMLTGETRPFKGGNFDRVRPFTELGKDGLGAFELALRYDQLDLSETPILARAGNEAKTSR